MAESYYAGEFLSVASLVMSTPFHFKVIWLNDWNIILLRLRPPTSLLPFGDADPFSCPPPNHPVSLLLHPLSPHRPQVKLKESSVNVEKPESKI